MNLVNLTVDQVARVYTGKPGCMCGCRGTYSDDPDVVKRKIQFFQRNADRAMIYGGYGKEISLASLSGDIPNDCQFMYIETKTTSHTVYFKQDSL